MIACPNCRTILPAQISNTGLLHKCPNCLTQLRAELFNAFRRPVDHGQSAEHVQTQGQAECYYHPGKMAVAPCSGCGRLLCALCEIPFDGRTLCTHCLQSGRDNQQLPSVGKNRFLYDNLALALAAWPIIVLPFIFFTIITAPAAIYVVLRYWGSTHSLLPRTKYRFVLALLLALAELVGWVSLFVGMLS